ncbi:MAG TPA: peptidoglycan DD-metalloendopeptidase family protein [Caulobacteraceae bacterium]|nr:peptidoglycan DD-metalloendopeptidase family protein [Caulobacteraceae bacterium]
MTAALTWRVFQPAHAAAISNQPLDPTALAALEARAFETAAQPQGLGLPRKVSVKLAGGESVDTALRRLGVTDQDASGAARALAASGVHSASFDAAVASPRDGSGPLRLIGLSTRTGAATTLTLSRAIDGTLEARRLEEKVSDETTVAHGRVNGSLFESAAALGATSAVTDQVVKLFQHKLDFARDITGGDQFTLVFDRERTETGRTVETGQLLFAELQAHGAPTRLYRFLHDGKFDYFDDFGKNIKGFLLRTPVDGARMNSNFGMRMHPVLGYMRMHQGVDFAASTGTPILAAGDGVVEEARRWGGYGNWLKIRHNRDWETGYGHISRYAPGIRPGVHVHQGQVVAYVGATGLATGPHLHYETWLDGKRVNPAGVKIPAATVLTGRELNSFKVEKARIDALIVKREREDGAPRKQAAPVALRPILPATTRTETP